MQEELILRFHGTGNAWPVPLGEDHPFYSRLNYADLSNAAYSLIRRKGTGVLSELVVDAGHGTIQSMLSSTNRLPEAVCLTHGHLDHTLSLDWIAQSYFRKNDKKKKLPVYCTSLVSEVVCASYPHLENLLSFRELKYGEEVFIEDCKCGVTALPVYHGPHASGAVALLVNNSKAKVLFSGDLLTPLFCHVTYKQLQDLQMLVVDSNNRFPYPGSNHWSISASSPTGKDHHLQKFVEGFDFKKIEESHIQKHFDPVNYEYFSLLKEEFSIHDLPFSVAGFLKKIRAAHIALVHYSGSEDERYYEDAKLSKEDLKHWTRDYFRGNGITGDVLVPGAGEEIVLGRG